MVQRLMCNTNSDFYEGVRAVLVDKDHSPRWNPPTLTGVTTEMVAAHFEPLPASEELHFD